MLRFLTHAEYTKDVWKDEMRTSTGTIGFDDLPTSYEDLVRLYMPRPIHDEVELENATELIDLMAGHHLSVDQEDYVDLLSDLVAKYEEATSPIGKGVNAQRRRRR